jgi:hypothetical protein
MLKYKISIILFVLRCMKYSANSRYNGTTSAWMVSPYTQRIYTKLTPTTLSMFYIFYIFKQILNFHLKRNILYLQIKLF